VRLFLDTSVLLAACGSAKGASREIFRLGPLASWALLTTPYVLHEVEHNLAGLGDSAQAAWPRFQELLEVRNDILTLNRPAVFGPSKDRPILFSALAWADILITLDRRDFGSLLGNTFYGLAVMTPGMFLESRKRS
jgi:predicted nucleic acid-binding protein